MLLLEIATLSKAASDLQFPSSSAINNHKQLNEVLQISIATGKSSMR